MTNDVLLERPDWIARRLFWTEERERQLRTMLTYHDMSCIEMARALGTTKNSICGKTKRMGLSAPAPARDDSDEARNRRLDKRNAQALARRRARRNGQFAPKVPSGDEGTFGVLPPDPKPPARPLWKPRHRPAQPAQAVSGEPVDIVGLTEKTCRWPLWEDGRSTDKMYCGAPVVAGQPYCLIHFRLATPPKGGR